MDEKRDVLRELAAAEQKALYKVNNREAAEKRVREIMGDYQSIRRNSKTRHAPAKHIGIKRFGKRAFIALMITAIIGIYGYALYDSSLIKPKVDGFVNDVKERIINFIGGASNDINIDDFSNDNSYTQSEEGKGFGR